MIYPSISRQLFDAWFGLIPEAKPFLRWAGGKQTFLTRYGKVLPIDFRRYVEPFLGGGSVFLYVARRQARPFQAVLGDVNSDLIVTWRGVRDDPEGVYRRLEAMQVEYSAASDKSEFYYARPCKDLTSRGLRRLRLVFPMNDCGHAQDFMLAHDLRHARRDGPQSIPRV